LFIKKTIFREDFEDMNIEWIDVEKKYPKFVRIEMMGPQPIASHSGLLFLIDLKLAKNHIHSVYMSQGYPGVGFFHHNAIDNYYYWTFIDKRLKKDKSPEYRLDTDNFVTHYAYIPHMAEIVHTFEEKIKSQMDNCEK
jgi:hypothetical protein